MYTTRAGKDVLEAQNVHKCCPMLVSVSLVLLLLSRAIYNIIAVRLTDINVFGNGYIFTTDMASSNSTWKLHKVTIDRTGEGLETTEPPCVNR